MTQVGLEERIGAVTEQLQMLEVTTSPIIIIIIIIIINLEEKNSPKPERYSHDFGQVGVAESNVMLSLASHFDSMEAERCMAKMEMRRVKVGNTIITIIIITILLS